jgi:hypothetical protein
MSILLSRVSLDDYQLKVRNLLRNSEFRDVIMQLPKGNFVFPELDLMLTTEPFASNGKPYEWKQAETRQTKPQQPRKKSLGKRLKEWLKRRFQIFEVQPQEPSKEEPISEEDKESQEDGYIDRDEEEDSDLIEFGL